MATQLEPQELRLLQDKALWPAAWMVHNANHLRPKMDEVKVGGRQASCASRATLMTALYGRALRPQDRLGSVHGRRVAGLGGEHFGQTGTVADLYCHFGIDRNSILQVIAGLAPGRPLRAVGGL